MIKGSSRYAHSVLVGRIMAILAMRLRGDVGEWELVGLLHDLDYDSVQGDMTLHGVRAAERLAEKISKEGLDAIKSHDHRTGYKSGGPLAESLRFADAVTILMDTNGFERPIDQDNIAHAMRVASNRKPWITEIIESFVQAYDIRLSEILDELGEL